MKNVIKIEGIITQLEVEDSKILNNINLDKQTIEISSKSLFTLLESNVLYIDELKLQTFYSNWRNYLYLSKVMIDIKSENFNDIISCWDNFSSDQLKEMDLILNNKAT